MTKRDRLFTTLSVVCIGLFAFVLSVGAQTYVGEAAAVKLTLDTAATDELTTAVNWTGPLPSDGGNITLTNLGATVGGGLVTVGDSTVMTTGAAGAASSMASVDTLGISLLGTGITADVVQSTTDCACPTGACTGSSTITGLNVLGTPITITGAPNQFVTVTAAGVQANVYINEQILSPGAITVNALRIELTVLATLVETEVIVAQAHSGVTCAITPLSNYYSGRAYGLWLRDGLLLGSGVNVIAADTGFLPTSGGAISVTTAGAALPAPLVLNTGTVTSNTSGGLPGGSILTSQSNARVENLEIGLTVLGLPITIEADVVSSQTQCACALTTPVCAGSANLVGLTVQAGALTIPVAITGLPNQHVELQLPPLLPILTLVLDINSQRSAGPGDITTEALRIGLNVTGVTNLLVVVASSHSDIICGMGPSAGEISVSGRALDAFGTGISNVRVTATDSAGKTRAVRTNNFGNYLLTELDAGETYIIDAGHKTHLFLPVAVTPTDDLTGIDLIAQPPLPRSRDR